MKEWKYCTQIFKISAPLYDCPPQLCDIFVQKQVDFFFLISAAQSAERATQAKVPTAIYRLIDKLEDSVLPSSLLPCGLFPGGVSQMMMVKPSPLAVRGVVPAAVTVGLSLRSMESSFFAPSLLGTGRGRGQFRCSQATASPGALLNVRAVNSSAIGSSSGGADSAAAGSSGGTVTSERRKKRATKGESSRGDGVKRRNANLRVGAEQGVPPLRVLPIGGLGEIGMNCMLVGHYDRYVMIDAGLMFPE